MVQLSGMEISSSPGLKVHQKLPRGRKTLAPMGHGLTGDEVFSHGLIFEGFLTCRMKKFSYPTTATHSEILFL